MKFRMTIHRKLFLSHFLAVILVSGSIGTYFYWSAHQSLKKNLQTRLLNSAAMAAESLDGRELDPIRGPEHIQSPIYTRTLDQLRRLRRTNPDIAFLYVMRQEADRVHFVIDSDETEKQALPGRSYLEVVPALAEGFHHPTVDNEIFQDEWGSFMSGYAPLPNGQGRYLVGIDMRADEVQNKFRSLKTSGIVSFCSSIFLALVFSRVLSRRFVSGIRLLIGSCRAIADGRLNEPITLRSRDEFDQLVTAFNHMAERLSASAQKTRQAETALTRLNEELESRVHERTGELEAVNAQLKSEMRERRRIEAALAEAARTDPLTGLLNRRAMREYLDFLVTAHHRDHRPFTLLMADIDHFKAINDHYGHHVGDAVLAHFSKRLTSQLRKQDLVARWGGEEFMVCLPDTDLKGGLLLAEKIRAWVSNTDMTEGAERIRLTVSIGVAGFMEGTPIDKVIQSADAALYQGKKQGRDRVLEFTPDTISKPKGETHDGKNIQTTQTTRL